MQVQKFRFCDSSTVSFYAQSNFTSVVSATRGRSNGQDIIEGSLLQCSLASDWMDRLDFHAFTVIVLCRKCP